MVDREKGGERNIETKMGIEKEREREGYRERERQRRGFSPFRK